MSQPTSMTTSAAWPTSPVAAPWPVLESGDVLSREDGFQRIPADDDGTIESRVFPGLRLDSQSLLNGDMARVLRILRTTLERR